MRICRSCDSELDSDGTGCAFCEGDYCVDCFDAHECHGHEPEFHRCDICWKRKEDPLTKGNGDGEHYCNKCAEKIGKEDRKAA